MLTAQVYIFFSLLHFESPLHYQLCLEFAELQHIKQGSRTYIFHFHVDGVCVKPTFPPLYSLLPISSSGKYSEYKPSWPPEPIGQNKLWKTNRNSSQLPRPPPGLTNQKQASPSPWGSGGPRLARNWGGGGINQESRFGPGTVYREEI